MVSWQRRALSSLCGRVDLLQQDIDRQAGAQTELEARLADLEQYVLTLAPRTWKQWQWCCGVCAYTWRSHVEVGPMVSCPRCGERQRAAEDALGGGPLSERDGSIRLISDPRRFMGPVAR
jgi:hypothetical protein